MARISTYTLQIPLFQGHGRSAISNPSFPVPEALILTRTKYPKISSTSISVSFRPTLSWVCCRASSSSSVESNESSSTKIFIKGLPKSITEGRLEKAFSEYGEVSQVKLPLDKESGEALGYAYIWFAKEESAQLAVKEMNGKFFDGRFIYVTIARHDSSKSWRNPAPYKF
ncbi:hypothetical protein L6164_012671 [Bauhinia variegata]|uniref:Uncharacterized protein n=1 Tax=Bauhinia variegata TaxID=167791 RepID=A0ACB9PAA1_BAUVA|nr:hypothetical protein L6164_012671 [Bauhinia variegata]